jgi:hypothetical protein
MSFDLSNQLRVRAEGLLSAMKEDTEILLKLSSVTEKADSNSARNIPMTDGDTSGSQKGNFMKDAGGISLPSRDDKSRSSISGSGGGSLVTSEESELVSSSPGYKGHHILTLSDEALRSTPISEMMDWYGQADGGGSCAGDFGNDLVDRWRETKQSYCRPRGSSGGSSGGTGKVDGQGSSIDCYLVKQTKHHGSGDNLCVMKNVAVQLGLFGDDSKTRPVVQHYVDTRHNDQPYIKFPKGFVAADCELDAERWQARYMPGWNADWTTGAVETAAGAFDHGQVRVQVSRQRIFYNSLYFTVHILYPIAHSMWYSIWIAVSVRLSIISV